MSNSTNNRIEILDGFRAISILSVIFFHFFSRWTTPIADVNIYLYSHQFDFFRHGSLGVQFFFIISGFVISYTLLNTDSVIIFWKKRMIRLFPAMFVASLATYIFCSLFDNEYLFPASHNLRNLIPSLTFLSPSLLAKFHLLTNTISGSYWSLWPEIQFYFLASSMYFLNKKHFIRNFSVLCITLILINHLLLNVVTTNKLNIELPEVIINFYKNWFLNCFNLLAHLPYFLMGTLLFDIYSKKQSSSPVNRNLIITILLMIYTLYGNHNSLERCAILMAEFILFMTFIYKPTYLNFCKNQYFTKIGKSSYFLYLIHEHIGIVLISIFAVDTFPLSLVFPISLIIGLIALSIFYTQTLDKYITSKLKKLLFK